MPRNGHFVPDIAIVREPISMTDSDWFSIVSVLDHLLSNNMRKRGGPRSKEWRIPAESPKRPYGV